MEGAQGFKVSAWDWPSRPGASVLPARRNAPSLNAPSSRTAPSREPPQPGRDEEKPADYQSFPAFWNTLMLDWSRTGSTSARHVDLKGKALPDGFVLGETLGESNSIVQEVTLWGDTRLAMKRYKARSASKEVLSKRNEIEILKRLRHHHVIELVGSFEREHDNTKELCALFWPVACFSFSQLFQYIDTLAKWINDGRITPSTQANDLDECSEISTPIEALRRIVFRPNNKTKSQENMRVGKLLKGVIRRIFVSFGCLADAVLYIHRQRVTHKDIKPGNILIYPNLSQYQATEHNPNGEEVVDGLRLTDFDVAKDLSQSNTTNASHPYFTRRYTSPETLTTSKSRRSGDIFSLGCVYLEMTALTTICPLLSLPTGTSATIGSYHSLGQLRDLDGMGSPYGSLAHKNKLSPIIDNLGRAFPGYHRSILTLVDQMVAPCDEDRPVAN